MYSMHRCSLVLVTRLGGTYLQKALGAENFIEQGRAHQNKEC